MYWLADELYDLVGFKAYLSYYSRYLTAAERENPAGGPSSLLT